MGPKTVELLFETSTKTQATWSSSTLKIPQNIWLIRSKLLIGISRLSLL